MLQLWTFDPDSWNMILETSLPLLHLQIFSTYLVTSQQKISVFPTNTYGEEVTLLAAPQKKHITDAWYLSVALYYLAV